MTEKPELEKNAFGDIIEPVLNDYGSKVDALVDSMEETIEPPVFKDSERAMKELKEDPRFMVVLHEKQLDSMATVIEEIAERLISLEAKVIDLETTMRFPSDSPTKNLTIGNQ
tara:strand:+ start:23 stop:361 length:339 start_codon:yes stop_codon:yes gene_type:complete